MNLFLLAIALQKVKLPPVKHHTAVVKVVKAPVVVVSPPAPVVPPAPPEPFIDTYDFGNCTAYVASRIHVPQDLGNANTWAERAVAEGYTVSPIPIVGSVAQTSAGYYGHVALVTDVRDGGIVVDEMNVISLNVVDTTWYPLGYFENYIYF